MFLCYVATIVFFLLQPLNAEQITITSYQQNITNAHVYECEGTVTVRYGQQFLIFADKALYDKNNNVVNFPDHSATPVIIQTDKYLITAQSGSVDGKNNTADFCNVEVYPGGEVISAAHAHKDNNDTWTFDRVNYTACACKKPHWRLSAHQAMIRKDKLCTFKSPHAVFNERMKVWLPSADVGLSGISGQSGFLFPIPQIHGGGDMSIYNSYYWNLSPAVDTTVGLFVRKDQGVLADQELRCFNDNGGCYAKIYGGRLRSPQESINPWWGWSTVHGAYAWSSDQSVAVDIAYGRLGQQRLFFHDRVPRADEAVGWLRAVSPQSDDARAVVQVGATRTLRFSKPLKEDTQWGREAFIDGLLYSSENYHDLGNGFLSNRLEGEFLISQKTLFDSTPTSTYQNDFSFSAAYAPTFFFAEDAFLVEAGASAGAALESTEARVMVRPVVTGKSVATLRLFQQELDNGMFATEVGAFAEGSTPHTETFRFPDKRYLFMRGVLDREGENWLSTTVFEPRFALVRNPSSQVFVSSDWQGESWHFYTSVLTNVLRPRIDELEWSFLLFPAEHLSTGLVGRYLSSEQMKNEYAKNRLKAAWHSHIELDKNKISTEVAFAQRKYGDGLVYPQSFKIAFHHWYDCWSWSIGYLYERFLEKDKKSDWAIFVRLSFGEHVALKQKVSW